MKKRISFFIITILLNIFSGFANELELERHNSIQTKIDEIGTKVLNYNKITKRIVFVYSETQKQELLDLKDVLTKRQIIVYDSLYKSAQNDDEIAAMLAREISLAVKSYDGTWGGRIDSAQIAVSPKKFEIYADKRAVDYMVKAGYNPISLIIYLNKTCPQKRSDKIARTNLTSKRLAHIYEYITYKYPQYLKDNEYQDDTYYQNFLLTSINNRAMLKEKIRTGSRETLKYE